MAEKTNNNEIEIISHAAILCDGGNIFLGKSHAECFLKIPVEDRHTSKQMGFVTNSDRFVNRQEAAKIAYKANQIDSCEDDSVLISEEIWDPHMGGKFKYSATKGYHI